MLPCWPADKALSDLSTDRDEVVAFRGRDNVNRQWIITKNRAGNWTLIMLVRNSDGVLMACRATIGTEGVLFPGEAT